MKIDIKSLWVGHDFIFILFGFYIDDYDVFPERKLSIAILNFAFIFTWRHQNEAE